MSKVIESSTDVQTPETDWKNLTDEQGQEELNRLIGEDADENEESIDESSQAASVEPEETPKPEDKETKSETPEEEAVVDESALKSLEEVDNQAPVEETPSLTTEQQSILKAIPSVDTARQVLGDANAFQHLDQALSSGNFESVEKLFAPEAWNALQDYIYSSNSDKWAQRYVDEKDGKAKPDPRVDRLEKELSSLREERLREQTNQQRQRDQQAVEARRSKLKSHIDQLVSAVRTEDQSAKRFVRGLLMDFLADDSAESRKAREQINQGKFGGLTAYFRKSVVPEYQQLIKHQKSNDQASQEKRVQQQQQKPIATPNSQSGTREVSDQEDVELGSDAHWKKSAKKLGFGKLFGV